MRNRLCLFFLLTILGGCTTVAPQDDLPTTAGRPLVRNELLSQIRTQAKKVSKVPTGPVPAQPGKSSSQAKDTPVVKDPATILVSPSAVDYDVRQVISDLSAQSGVSLLMDDSLNGTVSITADKIPLTEALEKILLPIGGTFRWMNGYFLIGSNDPKAPIYAALSDTHLFRPKFLKAVDLKKLLHEPFTSRVLVDEKRNLMTINADTFTRRRILTDLEQLDRTPRQVLIEAVIADITEDGARQMGLDWKVLSGESTIGGSLQQGISTLSYAASGMVIPARQILTNIKMLEEVGHATLRSAPRLTVGEGEDAKVFAGQEEWFGVAAGSLTFPTVTLVPVSAGTTLELSPTIGDKDQVTLSLKKVESGEAETKAGGQFGGLPLIQKRTVMTTVHATSGETITIAGLQSKSIKSTQSGIPILSQLPGIGSWFSLNNRKEKRTELVIFISVYVLSRDNPEAYHATLTPTNQ